MTEQRTYTTSQVASLMRSNLLAWGAAATLFCAVPTTLIFLGVPKFEEMFRATGADLPRTTMLLLHWRYLLWALPAIVLMLAWFGLTRPPEETVESHRPILFGVAAACCASLILQGLAVLALYAPIFRMGEALQ